MRVVVVGGGISGLTAAYLARAAGHDVVCVDPAPAGEAGGLIHSERHEGFLCEAGPQAVIEGAPETTALIAALGLQGRSLRALPDARRRFLYARGRLHALPLSPPALLRSGLLTPAGKLRLLVEPLVPARRRPAGDDAETVAAFGARRLGSQAAETLLATAVIGIYAAEAGALSLASAFPRLAAMERDHGSLFRGMLATRGRGARGGGAPLSFPDGLGELPAALEAALGAGGRQSGRAVGVEPLLATGAAATPRWRVTLHDGRTLEADTVVLAAETQSAANLLRPLAPAAHQALAGMPAAPIAVCCLGFRNASAASLGMDLKAYGFLVARHQGPRLLGCQFESSTFSGRAPPGGVLLRALLGGAGDGFESDIVARPDAEIVERALADLATVAGLKRRPDVTRVWKYREGIPLYVPGHAARLAALEEALRPHPGLLVIGHGLRGAGVNESIRAAAELVRAELPAQP